MKQLLLLILLLFFSPIFAQEDLSSLSHSAIDSLVRVNYMQGRFDKAIPYLQAGLEKAIVEKQDSVYANYVSNLGFFYKQNGQYEKAKEYCLKAKNSFAKRLGKEHPFYATAINNLAMLYYITGDYDKAESLYLECIDIRAKALGKEHLEYASALNNLGLLYANIGFLDKAESLYLQSKSIYTKVLGENHPDVAMGLNNLASLYLGMKSYEKAEPLYLNAINIYKKTVGTEHPYYGEALNNLAYLYYQMGFYEQTEPLYLQSLEIIKKSLGEKHPSYALTLNGLALLYQSKKQYNKAEKFYLEALQIQQKNGHRYTASLNNLAALYKEMQDYKKSEDFYLQSKFIWEKTDFKNEPNFATLLNNLSELYFAMEKLDTALSYSLVALDLLSKDIDSSFYTMQQNGNYGLLDGKKLKNLDKFYYTSNQNAIIILSSLLSILEAQYQKTNDRNKVEIYDQINQAAIRFNQRIRNEFSSEKDKLQNLAFNNYFVLGGIRSALLLQKNDYQSNAFSFAEMNKGVLLMEAMNTESAYGFGDLPDSLIIKEKKLQKEQSDLQATLLNNLPTPIKDSLLVALNKVQQSIGDFTKNLKTKYPQYAAIKYETKNISASEVQKNLDDKTALLEYVIGDSALYIFYIDKNTINVKAIALSNQLLSSKINTFHNALSNYKELAANPKTAYENFTFNAYWFFENLIAPVLSPQKTGKIKNLIIIPDSELGHLPFETFLVELAPQKRTEYQQLHYLIQDYIISYDYSATLWHKSKSIKTNNNGQILAFGSNYEIRLDSAKKSWRLPTHLRLREHLQPLPAARKEIETLKENFHGFFGLDLDVSEKNFKEKASDYAVIHLAMHGLLDAKNPILSSLAFTENGDSLENNFLQAYEISKMKLNADLVVLSACETGYGRFEKGNGIASLAQAFAYAGAPALIVSLWQVNDYATSEIMKNLYQNLANGMEKDEALQQAKIKYLNEAQGVSAHPAFWSPFILMGNTDAVYLKTKGGNWAWILGGSAILLVGIFAIGWRRKKQ